MAEHFKPGPGDVGFEHQDLTPGGVYRFLIGLAVGIVVVAVLLYFGYNAMDRYEQEHQTVQSPLVPQTQGNTREVSPEVAKTFPQPRLERNERLEINEFRLHEEQRLATYGWVDQKAGVVHIPIERAMALIAQRGLPTTPRVGTVPASEVNVVKQAAERSDTSNIQKKKGKQQ